MKFPKECVWLLTASLISLAASVPGKTAPLDGSQLSARMMQEYKAQMQHLCGYSVERSYTLSNKHMRTATMIVQVTYDRGQPKKFRVVSMNATGIARRSLLDLLHQETAGEGYQNEKSTLSPINYNLTILGNERCGATECYKVRMVPKQRSEYLVDGIGLISVAGYRFVEIKGTMSRSPSLWLSRPIIEQRFEDVNGAWLPSYNHSKVHVLFFGEADLIIQYSSYRISACADSPTASRKP